MEKLEGAGPVKKCRVTWCFLSPLGCDVHHVFLRLFPQHCVEHAQFSDWKNSSGFMCLIQLKCLAAFQRLRFHSCSFLSFMPLMQQSAKIPFGGPQFLVLLKTSKVEVRIVLKYFFFFVRI